MCELRREACKKQSKDIQVNNKGFCNEKFALGMFRTLLQMLSDRSELKKPPGFWKWQMSIFTGNLKILTFLRVLNFF